MRKTNTRSTKKNTDSVCAFCVSSFALFVFPISSFDAIATIGPIDEAAAWE
jgi:hypothetical protein